VLDGGVDAEAEVADFDHVRIEIGEEDVLGLDVPVNDVVGVHVVDGGNDLAENET